MGVGPIALNITIIITISAHTEDHNIVFILSMLCSYDATCFYHSSAKTNRSESD